MKMLVLNPRPILWRRWTEAIARRATLERLQKIADLYGEIGQIWGDVDESIVARAEDAISDVRQRHEEFQLMWDEHGSDA